MPAFLSPDWITAANEIYQRHRVPDLDRPIGIDYVITTPDHHTITVQATASTSGCTLSASQELDATTTVATDLETAATVGVRLDPNLVITAFLDGRVQVQGNIMTLLALHESLHASGIADDLAAITDP
ncbi:MAG: hypothetical protein CSA55_01345 [Ilumatobacter coccineus]|uniref:SCP2 domain-containing protein n=1 Tax=Ilumatobacter coccineus TaxID=467094 RepID=A0A2G6KEJ7_9ACTN|nr:MAG: hypothetical protein CSA55_01345 [Ilumatobacter coccineus]